MTRRMLKHQPSFGIFGRTNLVSGKASLQLFFVFVKPCWHDAPHAQAPTHVRHLRGNNGVSGKASLQLLCLPKVSPAGMTRRMLKHQPSFGIFGRNNVVSGKASLQLFFVFAISQTWHDAPHAQAQPSFGILGVLTLCQAPL